MSYQEGGSHQRQQGLSEELKARWERGRRSEYVHALGCPANFWA